ncbi:MAG: TolC family protein [Paludibacter sp.]
MKKINKLIIALLLLSVSSSYAQQNNVSDSLTLSGIMNQVIANYPLLKKADKELIAIDAKIGLTKTAYLPDVNFSSSYTRLGPTTSITMVINNIPHALELYPPNMYNATVSVNENIYDFGKTAKNIALDEKNKEMVQLTVEQAKQRISMAVMGNFYGISFLQEAIRIKDDQLKTLNEHLLFVQKKADTGSATKYEILTTKVRISVIENAKTDLQTALQIQLSQLNSFLGKPQDSNIVLKKELNVQQLVPSVDSLCNIAFANRYEMKMARKKEEISKSKLDVIAVQNNPSLNAFGSGGFKNGYFNSSFQDTGMLNYAVGIGFKMPLFDANRSKYLKIQANADLEGNQQETELTRRNITNEVVENRANALSALKKVKQSELQLQQASQAYELAEVSYKAGVITNLDLLDSYTSLSESKLALFKTKIDYSVNIQRLKIALGEKIY